MHSYHLNTYSPTNNDLRLIIEEIIGSTMNSVDPCKAVKKYLRLEGQELFIKDSSYIITNASQIFVVAVGKAAIPMIVAAEEVLNGKISRGIAITKTVTAHSILNNLMIAVFQGNHPVPGEQSIIAAEEVLAFLSDMKSDDIVIFLISGGGSALITKPVGDLSLQDLQEVTMALLGASVPIQHVNTIRKHLDSVKGGGLLKAALPAKVLTLVLSDVVGNELGAIASGPSVTDPGTFSDCLDIINYYQLNNKLPKKVVQYLLDGNKGSFPETIKPGQVESSLHNELIIGSVDTALQTVMSIGAKLGYHSVRSAEYLVGDIEIESKRVISEFQSEFAKFETEKLLMVWGGEVTVKRTGTKMGGRNMQMALMLAESLSGMENVIGITLATDGEDGSTEAAGAIIDSSTIDRAKLTGLSYESSILVQASFDFFHSINDLIITGSTGTNVNDLIILLKN